MKLSLKIGLVIMVSGAIWTSIVFLQAERTSEEMILQTNHSDEVQLQFAGTGIGYYKIYFPQYFGDGVFVQILDEKNNVISEKMVETKMSVNYFDHSNGRHTAKISNLSEGKITLEVEFGSTNSEELIHPGIVIIAGTTIMLITAYMKMKYYKMAQPDENIS